MQKATLFKKLDEGRVQCTCCQRYCIVEKGRRGFCGVRKNIDGELFLSVHGKAIAVNTDPVEKKPLYHFLPGSKIFSFGTLGCNFRCAFCQNWNISQAPAMTKEKYGKGDEGEIRIAQLLEDGRELSPKQIVDYCLKNEIPAIAYTYNEPTIFSEYAHDTGVLARKNGIKNVYVSNGYESKECLKYMKEFCDAINIDIKSFNEDFYMNTCGWVKLAGIKETIKRSREIGFWLECTTLVIPEENDSDEELKSIAKFLAKISKDIPWHVTAFHPDYKMTDKKATPVSTLLRAWKIGKEAGLKYVYIGNVGGTNHGDTLCPKCDKVLIERGYMDCRKNEIVVGKRGDGKCPECGTKIAGVWK
jgi:pyruvate formate lyase activating enzyme